MAPRAILLTSLVFAALAACRAEVPAPDVVARVGHGGVLRTADLEEYFQASAGDGATALADDVLSSLFDQFVDEELLRRLAVERNLVPASASRRRAAEALLRHDQPAVTEDEIVAYYAEHRADFQRPYRLRLRQILVADRAQAEAARREILAGRNFAEVARRMAPDPAPARLGEPAIFTREDLPEAFADLLFRLRPGEVSEVLSASYGHHVFQVLERLPARQLELNEAAPAIRQQLEREASDRTVAHLVEQARARYNVEVYASNLRFDYRGRFAGRS